LSEVAVELVESPSTQSATASLTFQNTAKYARHSYSCQNESGDLCPTYLTFPEVGFGIAGGVTVSTSGSSPLAVRGYVGGEPRDPVALLLGDSTWGHRESDGVFWWGGIDVYPMTRDEAERVKALISSHVPDTSSRTKLDSTVFTTSCARIQFRSAPPVAGAASWTESITAIVAKY